MFGIIRFLLAWFVVVAHIAQTYKYASALAVYAFFILSGYLMTLIMNERYGYTYSGIARYLINRSLRIYPQYWLVGIAALVFIVFISAEHAASIHPALRLPGSIYENISNVLIFGLYPESMGSMARLVPQAWALHVELVFYVLIGLFLGRNIRIAAIWFGLSIAYHIAANIYGLPRYSPVLAASIAFSIGSLLYHLKFYLQKYIPYSHSRMLAVTCFYLLFVFLTGDIPFSETKIPFYLNLVFFAVCLYQLSLIPRDNKYIKADAWFGDLSYPIYLCHWIVAVVITYIVNIEPSILLFLYCVPVIFLVSYLLSRMVENPIEIIRRKIAIESSDPEVSGASPKWRSSRHRTKP